MEVKFEKNKQVPHSELVNLYNSVGWSNYTNDPDTLHEAVIISLDVITAWEGHRLIGLIRTIGDTQTILYIQDLLVQPEYQHQGVGTELMNQILGKHKNIRQKLLLTENKPQTQSFYKKQGFTDIQKLNLVCFYREH